MSYVCCPIEHYRTDTKFDIVVMKDVFEHLFEPTAAMRTIADVTADHSMVLIQTCNRRRLRNLLWRLLGRSKISRAHFREYTPGELETVLRESGYRIEKLVGLGFLPGLGRLRGQHDWLFALDLSLGANLPSLAGGIMAACRRAQTD
jgi:2-polyprenyl-3-methyl-5-hydroxy-6-metoxy-1,4-benzoquinol methylase